MTENIDAIIDRLYDEFLGEIDKASLAAGTDTDTMIHKLNERCGDVADAYAAWILWDGGAE